MNVIFLTLVRISDIEDRGIYQDLMRKFRDERHNVYIVTAAERRLGQETSLVDSHGVKTLSVKTLNVQKTNIVEKGIGQIVYIVSQLCLDVYLIQKFIFTDSLNRLFPLNVPIIMLLVIFAAYLVKMLAEFISQSFKSESYEWSKMLLVKR